LFRDSHAKLEQFVDFIMVVKPLGYSRAAVRSVRNYLFHIFDKLGVSTRVELVLYCLQARQKDAMERAS
jgi:hypothetical protein